MLSFIFTILSIIFAILGFISFIFIMYILLLSFNNDNVKQLIKDLIAVIKLPINKNK